MASGVYNVGIYALATGNTWSDAAAYRVALVKAYTFSKDHNSIGDWSSTEVTGTGYTATGLSLTGTTVTQDDANDLVKLDAADRTWTGATFSADGAVVTTAAGVPKFFFSFGTTKIANSGTFTLQWNSSGLVTIAQAT